jgi:hypothetical protein
MEIANQGSERMKPMARMSRPTPTVGGAWRAVGYGPIRVRSRPVSSGGPAPSTVGGRGPGHAGAYINMRNPLRMDRPLKA